MALSSLIKCGRWGETETGKGPVDLFPVEPTDEDRQGEETLNPGFKELLGLTTKKEQVIRPALLSFNAEDGT